MEAAGIKIKALVYEQCYGQVAESYTVGIASAIRKVPTPGPSTRVSSTEKVHVLGAKSALKCTAGVLRDIPGRQYQGNTTMPQS